MTAPARSHRTDPRDIAAPPFLGPGSVRRLCIDLVSAEQDRLLRDRRLLRRQHIALRLPNGAEALLDSLEIDEETLGFDSLALIDLAGSVSRYFCLPDSGAEDLLLVHRSLGDWVNIVLAHFDRIGTEARLGFETSGSTGSPKRIFQSAADLRAEADEIVSRILGPVPSPGRILCAVPPRHIYGFLWGVLLPDRGGIEVCDLHRSPPESILRRCRPGDAVIGTPFTWEQAAKAGTRLPARVTGVTSAGPSSAETWQAGQDLGLERLVEIYGSTETGGIGWRTAWDAPFRLSTRVFRDGDDLRHKASGIPLPLQDHLRWLDDTSFTVAGRRDTVVQVAGTNVNLDDVRRVLKSLEAVADAAVRLDGARIKAIIVPRDQSADLEALEEALRSLAVRRLAAPARPDRIDFAPALPLTATGKPADW